MAEDPRPLRKDFFVRFAFDVEHGADFPREKKIGRGGALERFPNAVALRPTGQRAGSLAEEAEDPARIRRIENDLRMRGDDDLPSETARRLAKQIVSLPLQDDVLVRIGLVEQNYRGRPGVKEREQEKHLERAAPGVGEVERPAVAGLAIFADDIGLGRRVGRLAQLDPEEIPDMPGERAPFLPILAFGDLQQEISQYLARPSLANQQILHAAVAARLVALDPRERRDMDDGEMPRRLRREIPKRFPVEIPRLPRPCVRQLGVRVKKLETACPRFPVRLPFYNDLDQSPRS